MNEFNEKEKVLGTQIAGNIFAQRGKTNFESNNPVEGIKVESVTTDTIFYCTRGCPAFMIPDYERDAFDKIVRDEKGTPKKLFITDNDGNNRKVVEISHHFERVPYRDQKTGKTDAMKFIGRYIVHADDERRDDILAKIRQMSKNPSSGIVSEGAFKESENASAYKMEKQIATLESENTRIATENKALSEKLKSMGAK
jgi:hypothetical protein